MFAVSILKTNMKKVQFSALRPKECVGSGPNCRQQLACTVVQHVNVHVAWQKNFWASVQVFERCSSCLFTVRTRMPIILHPVRTPVRTLGKLNF